MIVLASIIGLFLIFVCVYFSINFYKKKKSVLNNHPNNELRSMPADLQTTPNNNNVRFLRQSDHQGDIYSVHYNNNISNDDLPTYEEAIRYSKS